MVKVLFLIHPLEKDFKEGYMFSSNLAAFEWQTQSKAVVSVSAWINP